MVNNTPPTSQQKFAMSADASQPIGATMKEKLFPSAILSNAERNELHQQIYIERVKSHPLLNMVVYNNPVFHKKRKATEEEQCTR